MKRPLANCGPAVQWSCIVRLAPLIFTRRIGEACETAQKSAEARQPDSPVPVTWIVRFDSDRQKLSSAMQLFAEKHWLYTSTWPLIVTSLGCAPRPATSV